MRDVIKLCVADAAHVVEVHADWTCNKHEGVFVAYAANLGMECPLCRAGDTERALNRLRANIEDVRDDISSALDRL